MRRRHLLAVPAAALLVLGPLGGGALAAPPLTVSGESQVIEFLPDRELTEDVQRFDAISQTVALDDHFAMTTTSDLSCVGSTRSFVCHGSTEAVGTFDGDPAGQIARTAFRCDFRTLLCKGHNIITGGSGALEGTRGLTRFEAHASTGEGTYTSKIIGLE
jgi:hypothetical protein